MSVDTAHEHVFEHCCDWVACPWMTCVVSGCTEERIKPGYRNPRTGEKNTGDQ